ncbi:MAG: oligosaccharide flippase family protein, partial [Patescibacteria group bacterium]
MFKDFAKQSFLTFLNQIAVFLAGFFSLVIISRILGPEGRGVYSLIILIPGMIMAFGNLGLGSGNVYFIGSKKHKVQDVVSNSLIFSLILGALLVLVFWGLLQMDFFQKIIESNKIPQLYLWLVVLTIPLTLLLGFFQSVLMGRGEITNYNKINFLREILQLLFVIILLWVLKKGLLGAVLSHIVAIILAVLLSVFLVRNITRIRFGFHKGLVKDSFIYGGKVYLANMMSFLNYRLDMFLIAFFLNPLAVGLYSIAVGIAERLFIIPGAITTVLYPKISSMEDSKANEFTPKIARHTFFIM